MAASDDSRVILLGAVAEMLNQNGAREKIISQSLEIASMGISCRSMALYRKHFTDREHFRLERIAHFNGNNRPVRAEEITGEQWEHLGEGRPLLWEDGAGRGYFLAPVPLDKHLFGFIAVETLKGDGLSQGEKGFLGTFQMILTLWVAKSNLEKEVDDLLDRMPIPTMIEDTDGYITTWNPAMAKRTGWGADQILGKGKHIHSVPFYYQRRPMASDLMMYPDPEWESVYVEFQRQGDTARGMSLCPNMPGGPIYFSFNAACCYDLNNRLRGVIEFITDVTEEREIRRELRRSESLYRTITDFAGVGIIMFSKKRIIYMNRYVSELLGVSGVAGEIKALRGVIHPDDHNQVFACFEHLFENPRRPAQFEFRVERGSRMHHYRGYAALLDVEDESVIHFIFDDITLQKDTAEKTRFNELKRYHEDRLTSLGVMAAGIAHELNQPLNTIRVVTEGLLFGLEAGWKSRDDELCQELMMVSRQVARMSRVIQNIRDFSRDDAATPHEAVDINLAIENVFSMIGRQMEARGVAVIKELSKGSAWVEANLHRLEQVIMNLVVNARQALQECDRSRRLLWVKTCRGNGKVTLEVIDNATGVPEEIMEKIFEPFVTTKEVGQGTGLGLSISKSIIADFKGDITVKNNRHGGASFIVTIPVR